MTARDPNVDADEAQWMAAAVIRHYFRSAPVGVVRQGGGLNNFVFAIDHGEGAFIVRLSPHAAKINDHLKEQWAITRAREAGVPTPEVLEALAAAEAIVVGPSNPVISIGPILAVPGMREAIAASGAPVLAVSPFVAGHAVKGPTEKFMAALGRPSTAAGVASLYEGVIQAMVVDADDPDEGPEDVQVLLCPTLMEGREGRREVAERVLEFAEMLG